MYPRSARARDLKLNHSRQTARAFQGCFALRVDLACLSIDMPGGETWKDYATAERKCPMFVLPAHRLLELDRLGSHEELRSELVEWKDGMAPVTFISQTWLSFAHPDDEKSSKLRLLQALLRRAATGKFVIHPNGNSEIIYGKKLKIPAKKVKLMASGFVWFDIYSVPQKDPDMQGKAISSIASYVADASYFIVLAGAWEHADDKSVRDFRAWESRGWCRVEQLANALSHKSSKPLIVAQSPTDVRTYGPGGHAGREWLFNPVGLGNFTVEKDRKVLGPVLAAMIDARRAHGKAQGNANGMLWFRTLTAMKPALLRGTGHATDEVETLDEWLELMCFSTPNDGSATGWTPIRFLALAGHTDFMRELLARPDFDKVHINLVLKTNLPEFMGVKNTGPLHTACMAHDQPDMIKLLLEHGANALQNDGGAGSQPCHWAAAVNRGDNVDALLEANPDYYQPNFFGILPFAFVSEFGHARLMKRCIENYPQHTGSNGTGFPCSFSAYCALGFGDIETQRVLLDAGFDPDYMDTEYVPAPMFKKIMNITSILFRLFRHPPYMADQMQMCGYGCTALHGAAFSGNLGMAVLLLERGSNPGATVPKHGFTPLHCAAIAGHESLAMHLLNCGAQIDAKDKRGRTAARWASIRGHKELAAKLKPPKGGEKYKVHPAPGAEKKVD